MAGGISATPPPGGMSPHWAWNVAPDTISVASSQQESPPSDTTDVKVFGASEDSSVPMDDAELLEWEVARWQCHRKIALAASLLALAVASIAASHLAGGEHPLMYTFYVVAVVLLIAQCGPMRYVGIVPEGREAPLLALLAWLLCVIFTLAAPGRMRFLNSLKAPSASLCEEGTTALWLALVLGAVAAFVQIPAVAYAVLAQLVCFQYLILGLALPRPDCSDDGNPESHSGALLGLPPLCTSFVQLYAISLLLMVMQYQLASESRTQRLISDIFYERNDHQNSRRNFTREDSKFVFQLGVEEILEDIDQEECRWRAFLDEVRDAVPRGLGSTSALSWVSMVTCLLDSVSVWRQDLRSHAPNSRKSQGLQIAAKIRQISDTDNMNVEAVSQFVRDTAFEGTSRPSESASSSHRSLKLTGRTFSPLKTVVGLAPELRIGEWDFNAVDVNQERQGHVLQVVGFELLRPFFFLPRDPMTRFLSRLEGEYVATNPYHSHVHAADMCNSFYYLVTKLGLWRTSSFAEYQHAAMLLAGLGHDVGHFGRNNTFLVNSRHELALTYNDRSVMESFHASTVVGLLEQPPEGTKLLEQIPCDQVPKCRNLIISLILATDTSKHLEGLSAFRLQLGSDAFDPNTEGADQLQLLSMLFRAADIGHSAKRWDIHLLWSQRVVDEFHAQGDEEKRLGLKVSPLCEREGFRMASSQVGFLQFICLPTWRELARFEDQHERMRHRSHTPVFSDNGSNFGSKEKTLRKRGTTIADTRRSVRSVSVVPSPGTFSPLGFKEAGATGIERQTTPPDGELPFEKRKCYIAEVCLKQCEVNFQAWKAQADIDRVTSDNTPSVPSVRGSRLPTLQRGHTGSRHNTHTSSHGSSSSFSARSAH